MKNPKIYTRTGDKGKTSLYGGKRISKSHPRVSAYGTVDELNSLLGVLISRVRNKKITSFLFQIQSDLFTIGSHLALFKQDPVSLSIQVGKMEKLIDNLDGNLPLLKNFILPSGSESASLAHLARSVCRRAEREVVSLADKDKGVDPIVIIFLNRLSDLLFILARCLNSENGIRDVVWKK